MFRSGIQVCSWVGCQASTAMDPNFAAQVWMFHPIQLKSIIKPAGIFECAQPNVNAIDLLQNEREMSNR